MTFKGLFEPKLFYDSMHSFKDNPLPLHPSIPSHATS